MTGHDITIHEVIPATEESNSEKRKAVLQRSSNKWNCFVDTSGCELADGDHVTIRVSLLWLLVDNNQRMW